MLCMAWPWLYCRTRRRAPGGHISSMHLREQQWCQKHIEGYPCDHSVHAQTAHELREGLDSHRIVAAHPCLDCLSKSLTVRHPVHPISTPAISFHQAWPAQEHIQGSDKIH